MNGLHQIGYSSNGLTQIFFLKDLVRHKLIDAFHRFVGHKVRERARCVFGFTIAHCIFAATQQTIQPAQVGSFFVIDLDRGLAVFTDEKIDNISERHNVLAILILAHKLIQTQRLPWHTQKNQLILTRLALLTCAVQVSTHAQYHTELLPLFPGAGRKHRNQVRIRLLRPGITAIVTTQDIGSQRAHLLASPAPLSGFILARVIIEQVFMSRRHQGLNTVCRRRFTGAIATGKQINPAKFHLHLWNIAPVYVNHFFQIHDLVGLFLTGE